MTVRLCNPMGYAQLGRCGIGDGGGVALAHAAAIAPNLSLLHLNDNELGQPAAFALAEALSSSGLAELWLGGNPLSGPGTAAVLAAADAHAAMRQLDKAMMWFRPGRGIRGAAANRS